MIINLQLHCCRYLLCHFHIHRHKNMYRHFPQKKKKQTIFSHFGMFSACLIVKSLSSFSWCFLSMLIVIWLFYAQFWIIFNWREKERTMQKQDPHEAIHDKMKVAWHSRLLWRGKRTVEWRPNEMSSWDSTALKEKSILLLPLIVHNSSCLPLMNVFYDVAFLYTAFFSSNYLWYCFMPHCTTGDAILQTFLLLCNAWVA